MPRGHFPYKFLVLSFFHFPYLCRSLSLSWLVEIILIFWESFPLSSCIQFFLHIFFLSLQNLAVGERHILDQRFAQREWLMKRYKKFWKLGYISLVWEKKISVPGRRIRRCETMVCQGKQTKDDSYSTQTNNSPPPPPPPTPKKKTRKRRR